MYQKIEWHDWVPLKSAQQEINLGVRLPKKDEVEKARAALGKTKMGNSLPEVYKRETVLLANFPEQVPLTLQAHRIGNLVIAAVPCEVFAEIGLELKKRSPFQQTFTIELANGYNGYLPTPAQHKLGGYETWRSRASYLEVDASVKIVDTVTTLFERLK